MTSFASSERDLGGNTSDVRSWDGALAAEQQAASEPGELASQGGVAIGLLRNNWISRSSKSALKVVLGLVVVGAIWELIGRLQLIGTSWPPLTSVLNTFIQPNTRSIFSQALIATCWRAARGYLFGSLFAVAAALLVVLIPKTYHGVYRLAVVINAIPIIALGPFLVATIPRDDVPVMASALAVFFTVLLATVSGFRSAGQQEHDLFSVLGSRKSTRIRLLQLPSSVPAVMDGLKLGVPAAMLGAILGEWFGANQGLGVLMLSAMDNYEVDILFAAALLSAAASIAIYAVFAALGNVARRRYPRPAQLHEDRMAQTSRRGIRSIFEMLTPFWTVLVAIGAWAWWVRAKHVPELVLPAPTRVLSYLIHHPSAYVGSTLYTATVSLLGLTCGMLLGGSVALLMSRFPFAKSAMTPAAITSQSMPIIILIPIVASIFGYSNTTVVVVTILMSFFPALVFVESGLQSTPPGANDLFSVLGSSESKRVSLLRIPSAIPNALVALRISTGSCVLGALTAEYLVGQHGLGHMFGAAQATLNVEQSWGAVLIATSLAVAGFLSAGVLEVRGRRRWS